MATPPGRAILPPVPTFHANGIDIHYERSGPGDGRPRLLFLNGSGATIASSGLILGPFRERFDLVVHDQRGLGRTGVPDAEPTMADYAADAAAVLDEVGWPTARVFGISFGGMVAQELAVTSPERIERLVLMCTSPGGEGGSSYPLHELRTLPAEEQARLGPRLVDTRFTPEWLAGHPSDRALLGHRADATEGPAEAARGAALQLAARAGHDVWDRLPRITCPTLVAGGRYDGIAPAENSSAIASRIAGADLRLYEGGHLFIAQDAAAFPDVLGFLAEPGT
jgi:3-oxoadipate enol-lactonase